MEQNELRIKKKQQIDQEYSSMDVAKND